MSGFEIERIQERIHGMTEDQQKIVAASLSDQVLFDAVYGRFLYLRGQTAMISQIMEGGTCNA